MFTRVKGNTIRFCLPLARKTFYTNGYEINNFIPLPTDKIEVRMVDRKVYTFNPLLSDNLLLWTDHGTLEVGTYSVEVLVHRQNGNELRCFLVNQVNIVEVTDESELDYEHVRASEASDSEGHEVSSEEADESVEPYFVEKSVIDAGVFMFVNGGSGGTGDGITWGDIMEQLLIIEGNFSAEISISAEELRAEYRHNDEENGALYRTLLSQTAERILMEAQASIFDAEGRLREDYLARFVVSAREILATVDEKIYDEEGRITEQYSSLISQTARQITLEVTEQLHDLENNITENYESRITQTAREIRSDVHAWIEDESAELQADYRSEISQTATEIRAGVTEEVIDRTNEVREENQASLTITAREIRSEVSREISDLEGSVTERYQSEIRQTAEEISARVEANKTETDGAMRELSSELSITAQEISARVEDVRTEADNSRQELESQIEMTAGRIDSKVSQTDYDADNSARDIRFSEIEQTAEQIQSSVVANKAEAEGGMELLQSQITQQANLIETKVSQTTFDTVQGEANVRMTAIEQNATAIHQYAQEIEGEVDAQAIALVNATRNLQAQIDGQIQTWKGNVAPTLNNYPAEDWDPEDYEAHTGDLYYDNVTGYAYRFAYDDEEDAYYWELIRDTGISEAIALANDKGRIFTVQPYPPYQVGDLWVQGHIDPDPTHGIEGNDGAIMRCIYTRDTGNFNASDWEPAFDYESIKISRANFDILTDALIGTVAQYDVNGRITSSTWTEFKQKIGNISLFVYGNDGTHSGLRATGINVLDGEIDITANNFYLKNSHGRVGLALTTDASGNPLIAASNLEINGIFSTTAGSVWLTNKESILTTSQGYATTAETNAKDYALGLANSINANNAGLKYLADALLNGTTAIGGGLILSSVVGLGSTTGTGGAWQLWSGLSGEYDSTAGAGGGVAAWYGGGGGDYLDAFTIPNWATMSDADKATAWNTYRYARALFRHDGSGYLANGEISWSGTGSVVIHGATMYDANNNQISIADLIELKSWFVKQSYTDSQGRARYAIKLVTGDTAGSIGGFCTDGFISAGGLEAGSGGGSGSLDYAAMWQALGGTYQTNEVVSTSHLPMSTLDARYATSGDYIPWSGSGSSGRYISGILYLDSFLGFGQSSSDCDGYLRADSGTLYWWYSGSWETVYHSGNLIPLRRINLTGTTFDANTMTADMAVYTQLYETGNITGTNFPVGPGAGGFSVLNFVQASSYRWQLYHTYGYNSLYLRSQTYDNTTQDVIWSSWREFAFTDGNIATATALATSRNIWGQAFNGTADITGAMTGVTTIDSVLDFTNSTYLYVSRALRIYAMDGQTMANFAIGQWDNVNNRIESSGRPVLFTSYYQPIGIGLNGDGSTIYISTSGYVGIGLTNPVYKLDVNGNTRVVGKLDSQSISSGDAVHDDGYGVCSITRPNDTSVNGYNCYAFVRSASAPFGLGYNTSNEIVLGSPSSGGAGWNSQWLTISYSAVHPLGSIYLNNNQAIYFTTTGASPVCGLMLDNSNDFIVGNGTTNSYYRGSTISLQYLNTSDVLTTGLYLNRSGYVGVGTSTPSSTLHVNGTFQVGPSQYIEWDAANTCWKLNGNLAVTGFVSSGGVSAGSGSDFDEAAMWMKLADDNSSDAQSKLINPSHLAKLNISNGTAESGKYISAISYSNGTFSVLKESIPATGVTSITAGTGLSGGTITSTGTISLDVAGTKTALGLGTMAYEAAGNYIPMSGTGNNTVSGWVTFNYGVGLAFMDGNNVEHNIRPFADYNYDLAHYDNSSWRRIWDSGNDGSGSGLDADLLDGYHKASYMFKEAAPYTGTIDANTFTTNMTVYATETDLSSATLSNFPVSGASGGYAIININHSAYGFQLGEFYGNNALFFRCKTYDGDVGSPIFLPWKTIAFTDSNVASATALQTTRYIWGQSFDGTANVDGSITAIGSGVRLILKDAASATYGMNVGVWDSTNCRIETYGRPMYITSYGYDIEFAFGGITTALFLKQSNNYVGIGTTAPSYKLDVNGTANASFFHGTYLYKSGEYAVGSATSLIGSAGLAICSLYNTTYGSLPIYFGITDSNYSTGIKMVLNTSGNLTIGTSDLASTTYKLYVNGSIHSSSNISGTCVDAGDASHDTAYGIYSCTRPNDTTYNGYCCYSFVRNITAAFGLGFNTDNEIVLGSPSSNRGSGWGTQFVRLSSSTAKFNGNVNTTYTYNGEYVVGAASSQFGSSYPGLLLEAFGNGVTYYPIYFRTKGYQRMKIDGEGRLYLGLSDSDTGWANGQYLTWDATNKAWHLVGNFYADGFISSGGLNQSTGEWDNYTGVMKLQTNVTSYGVQIGNASNRVGVGGAPSSTYKFYVTGTAGGSSSWNSASDARLKTNIERMDCEEAIHIIMALKPSKWIWNDNCTLHGQQSAGLIAQEVQPVMPYAVSGTDYLSLTYSSFVAPVVATLQSHEERIKVLEKEIERLRAN